MIFSIILILCTKFILKFAIEHTEILIKRKRVSNNLKFNFNFTEAKKKFHFSIQCVDKEVMFGSITHMKKMVSNTQTI